MNNMDDIYQVIDETMGNLRPIYDLAPEVAEKVDLFANMEMDCEEDIKMTMCDGATIKMDSDALFGGLSCMLSPEFRDMIDCYNGMKCADAVENALCSALLNEELECDYMALHELCSASERSARYDMGVRDAKKNMLARYGFNAYWNALQLYDCIFGFERNRF